jgi:NADH dehydrogenase (ubiquinone) 1 alpha subcomplex subunit 6
MNYWKQLNHVMKYFRVEEDSKAKLPENFISGFLEVRSTSMNVQTAD